MAEVQDATLRMGFPGYRSSRRPSRIWRDCWSRCRSREDSVLRLPGYLPDQPGNGPPGGTLTVDELMAAPCTEAPFPLLSFRGNRWKREVEGRSFSLLRVHPDLPPIAFHYPLANCQANTRTRDGAAVQAFEDAEDAGVILGVDADSVVRDADSPPPVGLGGGNENVRRI